MEPLFRTTATNTLEEYSKFSKKLFYTKRNIIIHILLAMFLIFVGIYTDNPFFIVFTIIYPLLFKVMYERKIKKVFSTNRILQNTAVDYEFFDTYFTQKNECSESKVEYSKIHKIIESKTNMYIMIAENQGFILTKANFPQGLTEFLREKQKYKNL